MLQTVDMAGSNNFGQLDVSSYVSSMALSHSGDYLAFGDGEGQLHLWTTHDTTHRDESGQVRVPPFSTGVSPEWPDPADPPKQVAFDDRT
jgi:PAB-dependent poly(A)-specific ribonuclease subunit 2